MSRGIFRWLTLLGPGILVAATGVGAGDLATGAFSGSKLGLAILWAVVVGAFLKFVLNEGLMRWQLATGDTLLEGVVRHFGRPVQWIFLTYLLIWSYFVGAALMSACGVTAHAMLPLGDAQRDKVVYGVIHSAVAVVLVWLGGYRLFEKVMSCCIAVMFVVVVVTAVAVQPNWLEVLQGVVWPTIPDFGGEGLQWTIALLGGVGGTLTILVYGYWIREEGRAGVDHLRSSRIDLAVAYALTAVFGLAMVIVGSQVTLDATGSKLIVTLSKELELALGWQLKWAFLIGAWGAVFSSLLGVWQSVPYLFADFWGLTQSRSADVNIQDVSTTSLPYRGYLLALATVPTIGLFVSFEIAQKVYAIIGALFIPMLALVLLILNGQSRYIGAAQRNRWPANTILLLVLLLFLLAGWFTVRAKLLG